MTDIKNKARRVFAMILAMIMTLGVIAPMSTSETYAASTVKKITIKFSHTITYGPGEGGYTNLKVTDLNDSMGSRPVLCMQPAVGSPPDGTYTIDKTIEDDVTGKWRCIRNLVYYTPGYPGYSEVKNTWFDGYSKDEAIAVMHLAVSYAFAGRPSNLSCWQGTSTTALSDRIWKKAKTVADDLWKDDPNVPDGFKALYVAIGTYQNMVCGYLNDGKLKVTKAFENEEVFLNNDCYSRAGIKFTVYDTDDNKKVGEFKTDANGKVSPAEIELPEGTYKIVESHDKNGFTGNGDSRTVAVDAGATTTVSFKDTPVTDPVSIVLKKADLQIGESLPEGAATLENAEYTIRYYDGQYKSVSDAEASGKPLRTWVFKTDAEGMIFMDKDSYKVSGDALWHTTTGKVTFPLGTVLVQETKAPVGYLIDNKIYLRNITDPDNGISADVITYNAPVSSDRVKRGDILFIKSAEGQKRLKNVPFKITSKTTGESHIVVSDRNGYVNTSSSWNPHSQNTNAGSTSEDGVWFGINSKGHTAPVDDKLGALPYDDYTLEEQRCEGNEGYDLVTLDFTVSRNNVVIDFGTIDNHELPKIQTEAKAKDTDDHIVYAGKKATIVDTVSYSNFTFGETYKIVGTLMNKETGEAVKDENGEVITSEKTFKCKSINGTIDVEFTFDATKLAGADVVVFEKAYNVKADVETATHEDIEDEDQTIHIPDIHTTAIDNEFNDHMSHADKDITIVDTVAYTNLIPGKEYTIIGTLMNKETGKAIKDDAGKEVTRSVKFKPTEKDGTVDVTFTFSGVKIAGTTLVAFEQINYNHMPVAIHADLNDQEQSIDVPGLKTKATANDGKSNVVKAEKNQKIVDTVSYKKITVGKEYTLVTWLVDKNGKKIEGTEVKSVFTPEAADGETTATMIFDATKHEGETFVVFEESYLDGKLIAEHKDIKDKDQMIKVEKPFIPPQTGDTTNLLLAITMMLLSCAGFIATVLHMKKKRDAEVRALFGGTYYED